MFSFFSLAILAKEFILSSIASCVKVFLVHSCLFSVGEELASLNYIYIITLCLVLVKWFLLFILLFLFLPSFPLQQLLRTIKKTPSEDGALRCSSVLFGAGRLFLMNFQPGFLDYLTTRRGVVLPFKTCTWLWGLGGLEIDYYK